MPALRRSARIKNKKAIASNTNHEASATDEPLHCICNKPQDDRIMICCDECNVWHHYNCIYLSKRRVKQLSQSNQQWFCDKCKAAMVNRHKKKKRKLKRKSNRLTLHSPPKKRHKPTPNHDNTPSPSIHASFTDALNALLSLSNHNHPSFELPFAPQMVTHDDEETKTVNDTDTDIEILGAQQNNTVNNDNNNSNNVQNSDTDEDDDIEIQAGDEWIASQSFFKNKDKYIRDIEQKKKEEMNKYLTDEEEEEEEREFVVLNRNKTAKQDICPLTLKNIEVPLKNLFCPHVFEKNAIRNYKDYLIKNEKETRCPVPGCEKILWWVGY